MMKSTRKQYPSALKAKIVLEAIRETKTVAALATEHQIHPNLITKWKQIATTELPTLFERGATRDEKAEAQEGKVAELYQVYNLTPEARRALAERDEAAGLPLLWQAELLSVSRGSLYYRPRPAQDQEVAVKHRLDECA